MDIPPAKKPLFRIKHVKEKSKCYSWDSCILICIAGRFPLLQKSTFTIHIKWNQNPEPLIKHCKITKNRAMIQTFFIISIIKVNIPGIQLGFSTLKGISKLCFTFQFTWASSSHKMTREKNLLIWRLWSFRSSTTFKQRYLIKIIKILCTVKLWIHFVITFWREGKACTIWWHLCSNVE